MPSLADMFSSTVELAKQPRKIKVLASGGMSSGKTHFALQSGKKVYAIDSERGTELFMGRTGFENFVGVKYTADLEEVIAILNAVRADGGKSFDTLVIDSLTNIYLQLAAKYIRPGEEKTRKQNWGNVNLEWSRLVVAVSLLPVNFIGISQDKKNVDGETQANMAKATMHFADIGLRFSRNGENISSEVIKKDRGGVYRLGDNIKSPTFAAILEKISTAPAPVLSASTDDDDSADPAVLNKLGEIEDSFKDQATQQAVQAIYKAEKEEWAFGDTSFVKYVQPLFGKYWKIKPSLAAQSPTVAA
jgi:hypothetical protein